MKNISQTLLALRKQKKRFEETVIFNPAYNELDLKLVFIDKKDKEYHAIIIGDDKDDHEAIFKLVSFFFSGLPFKIITRKGKAKSTANLVTGNGVLQSVGNGWGTMGGVFTRNNDPSLYGLSNNHVIANLNNANQGDPVRYHPDINAGSLFNWITLLPLPSVNRIDAALFKINPVHTANWNPQSPVGSVGAQVNLQVYKRGHTTGLTYGVIQGINGSGQFMLNGRDFYFTEVISIVGYSGPFSDFGDSGSLVMTTNHFMVGLLFAKFEEYAYALPIKYIRRLLE